MDAADTDPDRPLFDAARRGDVSTLTALLDAHPEQLYAREKPYDMTLLHLAARHLPVVDLLLQRGLDVNLRDGGDNSYAMHWAAAAGSLDVVRRLADAGGDVIGRGDDHGLEVIGWATCWDECDDDAHRAVVAFLIGRGARHHIFSAVALGLADEVRRIVAGDSSALGRRQSRNENNQTPLHFAVQRHQPDMIALLLQLGADPLAVDGWGMPVSIHATTPEADRPVMQAIRALMEGELVSAARGHRPPRGGAMDLLALLALHEYDLAAQVVRENPMLLEPAHGVLHLMSKRSDAAGVQWLLERGADPNGRWAHWDALVTPLHLAASRGHGAIVQLLLASGADPRIRDSRHRSDPLGWAEFFHQPETARMLPDGGE